MDQSSHPPHERELDFEGTQNFRDLGGIPTPRGKTRFGVIYRSDRLSNLTARDGARIQDLGIRTIIDMRSDDERSRAPNRLPAGDGLIELSRAFLPRHTMSMFEAINSGEIDSAGAYKLMLKQYEALALDHVGDYRRIVDDLLAPGRVPAVVHCTSGKDRTGMVAAILLLALDAPTDAISEDYAMTEGKIEKVDYFNDSADDRAIEVIMGANPAYISTALSAMTAEFGSTDAYLRDGVGIDDTKRRKLAALLLEE